MRPLCKKSWPGSVGRRRPFIPGATPGTAKDSGFLVESSFLKGLSRWGSGRGVATSAFSARFPPLSFRRSESWPFLVQSHPEATKVGAEHCHRLRPQLYFHTRL